VSHNAELAGGGWSGWDALSLAGDKAKSLVVAANADGRLHAFRIGLDDQVSHNAELAGGGWSGWDALSLAGDKAKSLVVAANADGRLHAFRIGLDDQVSHNAELAGGGWSGWNALSLAGIKLKVWWLRLMRMVVCMRSGSAWTTRCRTKSRRKQRQN